MTLPTVFISYSHRDEKEKNVLLNHLTVLKQAGLIGVWSDTDIKAGSDTEEEINQAIDQAKIAVLLISANFLTSEVLQTEIPRLLERRQEEGLIVFPVIAKDCAWRRVGWLARLNVRPKHGQPVWRHNDRYVDEELTAVTEEIADYIQDVEADAPDSRFSGDFEIESPHGTMRPDSKFYIERTADLICWNFLKQPQAVTLFVQAPRQMGKSSLMLRMLDRAKNELNRRIVFIDLQELPKQTFTGTSDENFLRQFCWLVSEAFGIREAIERYWKGPGTNIFKCGRYLAQYVVGVIDEPFILALDEVDRLLPSPFRDDFFGMLRVWHNKRALDERFRKFSLFLSSSTESSLLIQNEAQSPFNVADYIPLQDFTRAEVEDLNRRHSSPLTDSQLDELVTLVGGHPFLTRLALYQVATGLIRAETLFSQATAHTGPFGDHLRYYLQRVLQRSDLRLALLQIMQENRCEEDYPFYCLKGLGLIKEVGPQIVFRNKLYARYFEARLTL